MTSFKSIAANSAVAQFDTRIIGQAEADEIPFCRRAAVGRELEPVQAAFTRYIGTGVTMRVAWRSLLGVRTGLDDG